MVEIQMRRKQKKHTLKPNKMDGRNTNETKMTKKHTLKPNKMELKKARYTAIVHTKLINTENKTKLKNEEKK